MLLYVVASPSAVSAVLVEEKGNRQEPVYYVSEVLADAKLRYTEIEKVAYAVVMATRKLKHYIMEHPITIPTTLPIGEVLRNPEAMGRISKWVAELAPHSITFTPRAAIKSQAVADFLAEWTAPPKAVEEPKEPCWTVFTDGAWGASGARAAAIVLSSNGSKLFYAARLNFNTTNNAAEYEAVLLGLRKLRSLGARRAVLKSDSKLVAGHVDKQFTVRDDTLAEYVAAVRSLEKCFKGFTIVHIPRAGNEEADALAKAAAQNLPLPPEVFFESLCLPAVKKEHLITSSVAVITQVAEEDWRLEILAHLNNTCTPIDDTEERHLNQRCRNYVVHEGRLYKKGVCAPLLRCLAKTKGQKLLSEMHEGICGAHNGPRELVAKAFRQGFYWPTAVRDAEDLVRRCLGCQWHGRQSHSPPTPLQPIALVWH